jgi:hypothetical protein
LNPGTGALAGTNGILSLDVTISCADGLLIRVLHGTRADFTGVATNYTGSFISLGAGFSPVYTSPSTSGNYTDLQTLPQFEVAGFVFGAAEADQGAGIEFADAMVPHGSVASVSGLLSDNNGKVYSFSYSA